LQIWVFPITGGAIKVTANTEVFYWTTNKGWYRFNSETQKFELTDEAPERARKSFELMLEKSKTGAL